MINTDHLEHLAASNGEMPDDIALPEQLLFFTLRELYGNFHSGAVNRERGQREKKRIYIAYRKIKDEYAVTEQHHAIRQRLSKNIGELATCGCPHCKKLINIFNGVDRKDIPDDVKELNAWNERLRDLVQERSERNAELATQLDRVRWALEKNDIERAKEILKCT